MGRLLFPLTPNEGLGAMLLIIKQMVDDSPARFLCVTYFAPCIGGRNQALGKRMNQAFQDPRWTLVRSLRRSTPPDESCWFEGDGWWLSTKLLTAEEVIGFPSRYKDTSIGSS